MTFLAELKRRNVIRSAAARKAIIRTLALEDHATMRTNGSST
jgi:hypothetical protein